MTPRTALSALIPLISALAIAPAAQAQRATLGTLSVVRQVEVTRTRLTPELAGRVDFEPARDGEAVLGDEGIRTLKRSLAEAILRSGSRLRLAERSEAILASETSAYLRQGAAWLHAVGGATLATPLAQVEVKEATVVVDLRTPQTITVTCLAGTATVHRGEQVARLKADETVQIIVQGNRINVGAVTQGAGGTPWWETIEQERGLMVTPGSLAGFQIRSSELTEVIQAVGNLLPSPREIVRDPNAKARLLFIAQGSIVPKIEQELAADTSLTLATYRARFGTAGLQRYPLSSGDLSFLRQNGIGNVGQLFDALGAAGSSFALDLRSVPVSRAVYRPASLTGPDNASQRLFDGAETSGAFIGLGLAAGLLLDRGAHFTSPNGSASVFGFTSDPQGLGGRVGFSGSFGKTRYTYEGNLARLLSGNQSKSYGQAISVLSFERELRPGVHVFAGRQRFYEGPLLQNQSRGQLIGERYSALGASVQRGATQYKLAALADSNPDVKGMQSGFLFSATRRMNGGQVGFHLLQAGKVDSGTGYSLSGSLPVKPGELDLYGEVGRGPDKANLINFGVYLPSFYQRYDTDVFLEYSRHEDLGKTISFIASRELVANLTLRAYLGSGTQLNRKSSVSFGGLGAIYRFNW